MFGKVQIMTEYGITRQHCSRTAHRAVGNSNQARPWRNGALRLADGGQERGQLGWETGETGQIQLLLAVAEGFRRVRMDFDEKTVRAHGNRASAKHFHQIDTSAALAGIDDDGQ